MENNVKGLIQEGRKIQETFKKNVNENVDANLAEKLTDISIAVGKETSRTTPEQLRPILKKFCVGKYVIDIQDYMPMYTDDFVEREGHNLIVKDIGKIKIGTDPSFWNFPLVTVELITDDPYVSIELVLPPKEYEDGSITKMEDHK